MFGFSKPVHTEADVIKMIEGMAKMKDPPQSIDVLFFANGGVTVAEDQTVYLGKYEVYTYELRPKGGPECSE